MRGALPILPLVVGLLGTPQFALAQADGGESDEDGRGSSDEDVEEEDVDLDAYEDQRRRGAPVVPDELTEADLEQTVLIVPFAGETAESTGVGVLLEGFLRTSLDQADRFDVRGLEECPVVEDVDAELYYEGCPAGDELGCQFVIGEGCGIDRVVSGRVTVMSEGRYRVVVTLLNVPNAELEFTYALDLAAGEEELLPRTVELALDRLRREEVLAPYRDAVEQEEARREALEEARTEEERRLVARMDLEIDEGELEAAGEAARPKERRISQADVEEIKSAEGLLREWDEIGITERQYISFRNSGLDFDDWRQRWAGHRLQIMASVHLGFIGGATGLRYYGGYLLDPELRNVVDSYAWQQVEAGSSFTIGVAGGFGILRNLDIEVGGWWSRSTVWVKLFSGDTIENGDGSFSPNPENHPPPDFSRQTVNLWGGDVMLRYFILTMPIVRPTVGAGIAWITYPNLYNDPAVDDAVETPTPAIQGRFTTFPRLTDFGVQLEPGVQIDIGKHLGIYLRVPITIGMSPTRKSNTGEFPPAVIDDAEEPGSVPFGAVRVLIGVQGRLLGLPVQPKVGGGEDVLEEICSAPLALSLLLGLLPVAGALSGCTEEQKEKMAADAADRKRVMTERQLRDRALEYWELVRWQSWSRAATYLEEEEEQLAYMRRATDAATATPPIDDVDIQYVFIGTKNDEEAEIRVSWTEVTPKEGRVSARSATQRWYKSSGRWWVDPTAPLGRQEVGRLDQSATSGEPPPGLSEHEEPPPDLPTTTEIP